jgi:D-alanyl-D-alanine carboxypeptidase
MRHRLISRSLAPLAALAALVAPGSAAAERRLDASTRAQLDRALGAALAGTEAPGVIAGVWVGDRGWTATRGVADRRTGRRPTRGMHTRIGSVTKTLTGTLVLRLADQGRLRLDDTIDRWFPDLPDAGRITVRQLGDMSSGIRSYTRDDPTLERYFTRPGTVWTTEQLIRLGTSLPRAFAPGDGFDYSNTNFVMLGRIVERVTGRPLARVMRDELFVPLGMRDTSYPATTALPRPSWRGITEQGAAAGAVRDATGWSPTFAGAAGQVVSTLGDLRRWTRALGTGALLRPATHRARLVPNPASAAGGRAYAFALGTDHGWLLHSGELPGFTTQIAYLPSRRTTVVVLVNADIPDAAGRNPAPSVFTALARVVAPRTLPGG